MKRFGALALVLVLMAVAVAPTLAANSRADQIIDRFFDAYRRGAVEEMLALYAPDAVFEDLNQRHTVEGTEQLREFLGHIVQMHTTIGIEETRRATTGNIVVVQYAYTGTLSGAALRETQARASGVTPEVAQGS